jgi:uncharacterized LabA/DUF88 family protein
MPSRVAIFVDGGYFDHVLNDLGLVGRLDYGAFFDRLCGSTEMLRAHYYHCLPYQPAQPNAADSERFARMESFLNALDRVPRTTVRKGKLEYRGQGRDNRPIFVQKRVDSLIATDLVLLSAKHLITEAVIVTGDSDLLPPIQIAKDEGVVVRLAHGLQKNYPHKDLWDLADERLPLTADWLAHCEKRALPPQPAEG